MHQQIMSNHTRTLRLMHTEQHIYTRVSFHNTRHFTILMSSANHRY